MNNAAISVEISVLFSVFRIMSDTPITDKLFAPLWAKDTPPTDVELHEVNKRFREMEREHAELITIANTINEFASGPMPWGGCKCDHGHDGRMPLKGPKCGRCLALERLREISSPNVD